jgi:hypothetical protein
MNKFIILWKFSTFSKIFRIYTKNNSQIFIAPARKFAKKKGAFAALIVISQIGKKLGQGLIFVANVK